MFFLYGLLISSRLFGIFVLVVVGPGTGYRVDLLTSSMIVIMIGIHVLLMAEISGNCSLKGNCLLFFPLQVCSIFLMDLSYNSSIDSVEEIVV